MLLFDQLLAVTYLDYMYVFLEFFLHAPSIGIRLTIISSGVLPLFKWNRALTQHAAQCMYISFMSEMMNIHGIVNGDIVPVFS